MSSVMPRSSVLQRFESQDPSGVLDLDLALALLRATHELLSEHTVLRPFDSILHDVNESEQTLTPTHSISDTVPRPSKLFRLDPLWFMHRRLSSGAPLA